LGQCRGGAGYQKDLAFAQQHLYPVNLFPSKSLSKKQQIVDAPPKNVTLWQTCFDGDRG
jgi:hypothetical protein